MTVSGQQAAPSSTATRDRLHRLFTPRSVAIVGASDRSSWSHRIRGALLNIGYDGEVYFVNPRGGTAHARGHQEMPTARRLTGPPATDNV